MYNKVYGWRAVCLYFTTEIKLPMRMQSKRAFGKNPLNTIQKHNPETHPVLRRPHALQTHLV
jgi:hypothetical protein